MTTPTPPPGSTGLGQAPQPSLGIAAPAAWPAPPPVVGRSAAAMTSGYVPGPAFFGAIVVLVACGIVGSSGTDFGFLEVVAVLAAVTLAWVWLICFSTFHRRARLALARRTQMRWALPPVIFFLTVALMMSGVPVVTRFELSRQALDQAVNHARAGDQAAPGWIGLLQIHRVHVVGETTVFDLSAGGLSGGCVLVYAQEDNSDLESWISQSWSVRDFGRGWWYGCDGSGD